MVLDPFPANKVFNYFFKLNDCIMKRIFSQSTKWGSIIALAVLFLFASEAKADHRYYYYPEYQIYYDNYRDVYVYFGYDGWYFSVNLPYSIRHVPIHRAHSVGVGYVYYRDPHHRYHTRLGHRIYRKYYHIPAWLAHSEGYFAKKYGFPES